MAARPRYPQVEPIAVGEEAYKGGYATHQIIDGKAYPFWEAHLHLMQNSYARAYDQFWGPNGFGAMPDVIQHVAGGTNLSLASGTYDIDNVRVNHLQGLGRDCHSHSPHQHKCKLVARE